MTKKRRFPEEIPFSFMGFTWTIKFINMAGDCHGETDTDSKEVRIFYKDRTDENILETIIHEMLHVALFDTSEAIFHFDSDRIYNKEENLVRLVSPRVFHLIMYNPKLFSFLQKEFK